MDLGAGPNYISNNTFYGTDVLIKYTSGYDETKVYNNIFCEAGSVFNGSSVTTETDYNLYFNSSSVDIEENSIYDKDPLFVNPGELDFSLRQDHHV